MRLEKLKFNERLKPVYVYSYYVYVETRTGWGFTMGYSTQAAFKILPLKNTFDLFD